MDKKFHEVFVGTETGTFKCYNTLTKNNSHLRKVSEINSGDQIVCLNWYDDSLSTILIGQQDGTVKVYDTTSKSYSLSEVSTGENKLIGVSNYNESIITGVESGIIRIWDKSKKKQIEFSAGQKLDKMIHSTYNRKQIATGGNETALSIWDLETQKSVFIAKNVPHNELQLREPVWVADIDFLSETGVATVSRYGHACFYDTRAQRRPVTRLHVPDSAYSCISATCQEFAVAVGGGKGLMNLIDLRKPGKILHKYKGFVGAVKDVKCDPVEPLIFTVSLDRRMRIHNMNSCELLDEVYMNVRLNSLLVKPVALKKEKEEDVCQSENEVEPENVVSDVEDPGDEVYVESNIYGDEEDESDEKQLNEVSKNKRKRQKQNVADKSNVNGDENDCSEKQVNKKRKNKRKRQKQKVAQNENNFVEKNKKNRVK